VGSGKIKAQTVVADQKEKSVPIPNTVIQLLHKFMQGRALWNAQAKYYV